MHKDWRTGAETLDALVDAGMTADVPSDFMPRLALIDGSHLREGADDQRNRLAAWRTDGRQRELRHALQELEESLARHVTPRELRDAVGLETAAKALVGDRTQQALQVMQLIKRWGGGAAASGIPALIALTTPAPIGTVVGA